MLRIVCVCLVYAMHADPACLIMVCFETNENDVQMTVTLHNGRTTNQQAWQGKATETVTEIE